MGLPTEIQRIRERAPTKGAGVSGSVIVHFCSTVNFPCASCCRAGYNPQCAQDSPQGPPRWCADSWCYVDPDSCDKPSKPGTLASDLHYSYGACGFVDIYSPTKILSNREIRFTFMGEEFYRQFSEPVVQTNGATTKAWRGVLPEFFTHVVELMGLENTVEVPLTQASIDYVKFKYNTSSVYTACAALIATNGTDWCVGDVSSYIIPSPLALPLPSVPWFLLPALPCSRQSS